MPAGVFHGHPPAAAGGGQIELAIGGMTCASCAARIEKTLNKLDGITAAVDYATEEAKVRFIGSVTPRTAVPLAAGVPAPIGFMLPMEVGALLMSLSTVVVALNARMLRRLDLRPEASVAAAGGGRPGRRESADQQPAAAGHR